MGNDYSYIGAVVGATYPEMGKVLRKVMPKSYILVPGYGAQVVQQMDLSHTLTKTDLVQLLTLQEELFVHTSRTNMLSLAA
mgnify:CR=1 FL=1